jgi:hypothetical protein
MTPSTENQVLWLWSPLEGRLPGTDRLERLRVSQADTLGGEVQP